MKKIWKRVCTGILALTTILTALPITSVQAAETQYWTESAERVGHVEHLMNDGTIKSTFNEGHMKVEGETAYCVNINMKFKNGYKTRHNASASMSADQIEDVALSIEYMKQYAGSHSNLSANQAYLLEQCLVWQRLSEHLGWQCDNVRVVYSEISQDIQNEVYAGAKSFVKANKGRYKCGGYIYTGEGQDIGQFWAELNVGNAKVKKTRSVEDIDEVALSYAEIKALAVGNPYIKEKMDLDIQVSKLQLFKQSFLSQKYEMEDKAVRYFPNEIRQCEQRIADYESDIALAKENTPPDRETFPEMQIHDVVYTEKKEAGQAIIEACKAMKSADAVLIGRYRGFPMKLSYDSFQKVFVISMYGKQVYHVPLGTDIHGNITRLDNKIQEIPDKMLRCQDKLENLKVQLENAKEEAQKEFPQEAELAEKVARLGELNVLLDMDKKDQVLLDDGEGVEIEPEQKKKERER